MPKVALIQVVYNSRRYIPRVYSAALQQTEQDFEFHAVIAANEDHGKEYIEENFPTVKVHDPGYNIGFARGHNDIFSSVDVEFFQLVNPDLIMTPNYVEELLRGFSTDKRLGATAGGSARGDTTRKSSSTFSHGKPRWWVARTIVSEV